MTPENIEKMRLNLIDYVINTVDAWLRLAHFDQTPEDRDGVQLRISWEYSKDEHSLPEGDVIAHVKELHGVDPLVSFRVRVTAEALPQLPPVGPEKDPAMIEEMKAEPEWVPATFSACLAGDRIRIGNQETDVRFSSVGEWHANNADPYRPTRWDHQELIMDLAANPGRHQYPLNTPCEIFMTPDRRAVFELQQQFPGSQVVS